MRRRISPSTIRGTTASRSMTDHRPRPVRYSTQRSHVGEAERQPGQGNEGERDSSPGGPPTRRAPRALPASRDVAVSGEIGSHVSLPRSRSSTRSMPQSSEEHRGEKIHVGPSNTAAVAAEGDVEIVPQSGRQRDMPPLPELGDAGREVGVAKVAHQLEPEKPGGPSGDVAVAGEVAVDLEGVQQDPDDEFEAAMGGGICEVFVGRSGRPCRQSRLCARAR